MHNTSCTQTDRAPTMLLLRLTGALPSHGRLHCTPLRTPTRTPFAHRPAMQPRGARGCPAAQRSDDLAPVRIHPRNRRTAHTDHTVHQPAFADFEDGDEDTAFVRALNSLRRGIIMLFLGAHNSLAAQQAFLLLEVCHCITTHTHTSTHCQALTRVPPELTLQRLVPVLTPPIADEDDAQRKSIVPTTLEIIKEAPRWVCTHVLCTVLYGTIVRTPHRSGVLSAIQDGWFQARLLLLSVLTAAAFMIAGVVCIILGMPPQRTSLAVEPARVMLGRYVQYLHSCYSPQTSS